MFKYWLSLVVAFAGGGYALCAALYFAWVTATPITPEQLARARYDFKVWLALFALAAFICSVLIVRMVELFRRRRHEVMTTIPPRNQLPKSLRGLSKLSLEFPRLAPDTPFGCPRSEQAILEYLRVEAPGGVDSGSATITNFELCFLRTALVNGSKYWIWGFKDDEGSDCYVAVQLRPDGTSVLGYDESFGLSPEQWLVMDYYDDEEWDNEE